MHMYIVLYVCICIICTYDRHCMVNVMQHDAVMS